MSLAKLLDTLESEEQKAQMLDMFLRNGKEIVITYVTAKDTQVSSNIFLPSKLNDSEILNFLLRVYGIHTISKVIFDVLPEEEQKRRFRACKVKCGRINDMWY